MKTTTLLIKVYAADEDMESRLDLLLERATDEVRAYGGIVIESQRTHTKPVSVVPA